MAIVAKSMRDRACHLTVVLHRQILLDSQRFRGTEPDESFEHESRQLRV
jgi:hypothetical protein